jgi:hypothetical protein
MTGGPGLLWDLSRLDGVRGVILVDLAGRIVDRVGFEDRRVRTQVATLVAGLHAAGARLAEASGRPGRNVLRIDAGGEGTLEIHRVPPPAVHLLLLHLEGGGKGPAPAELERLLLVLAAEVPGGPLVADASAFEKTLETDR